MNKYLEKIAAVPHFVKARRRLAQMLQQGSHDFKSMNLQDSASALSSGSINPGTWGTHGAGVYAGHKAPAHGYQVSGHSNRIIAFPTGGSQYAVPHANNLRFKGNQMPVQDTVIPHSVPVGGKGTYVSLPAGLKNKKSMHPGDADIARNMEESIRTSRSRRIYDDDLEAETRKRGLTSTWDSDTEVPKSYAGRKHAMSGENRVKEIQEALYGTRLPRAEQKSLLRQTTGELANFRKSTIMQGRKSTSRSTRRQMSEDLHDLALQQLARSSGYEKYTGKV